MSRPKLSVQLARGLRRQCPHCGLGGIFRWWALADFCPRCGHRFEREPGYWVGAVIVNTILAIVTFLVSFGAIFALTWPEIPWTWLTPVVMGVTGLVPWIFYPWARSLWMAYDFYVHPLEEDEIQRARERLGS